MSAPMPDIIATHFNPFLVDPFWAPLIEWWDREQERLLWYGFMVGDVTEV